MHTSLMLIDIDSYQSHDDKIACLCMLYFHKIFLKANTLVIGTNHKVFMNYHKHYQNSLGPRNKSTKLC